MYGAVLVTVWSESPIPWGRCCFEDYLTGAVIISASPFVGFGRVVGRRRTACPSILPFARMLIPPG